MKRLFFLSLISFLLVSVDAIAGKRYWTLAIAGTWNNTANWSTTSGGGGGAAVPTTTDTVYIGTNDTCTLDINASIKRLEISGGILNQSTYTFTIGTTGASLTGGSFNGGTNTITLQGAMTINGCAFTSTSGTLTTNSNFTYTSGSFTHNSGTFTSTATSTISGTIGFYNVTLTTSAGATYTISNTITADNTLTLSGSGGITLNTGTINAKGNISNTNSGTTGGGSALIEINGSGTQTLTASTVYGDGRLCNVKINKTSTDTLKLINVISVVGNWTYTDGEINYGTSVVYFIGAKTISGSHSLNTVLFGTGANATVTIASGTVLTVEGNMTIGGNTQQMYFATGDIHVKGNLTSNNTDGASGGTTTITLNGTGSQTLTGGATWNEARLPNIVINKSSGTLSLSGYLTPTGDWTYTAGTISPGTSTVYFVSNNTISGSHTLYNVGFGSTTCSLSNDTLTVSNTLVIAGTGAVVLNSGRIMALGNINVSNVVASGGGSATIEVSGSNNQSFAGNTSPGNGRLCNIKFKKTGGTVTLSNTLTVNEDWTYTSGTIDPGSSTVYFWIGNTVTGNHTLNNVTYAPTSSQTFVIASGTVLTTTGTLTYGGSASCTINTGTLEAKGNITYSSTVTSGSGGSALLLINGTGSQTFTGSTSASAGRIGDIQINKTSGTLSLSNHISVYGDFTYTAGTISAGTSTFNFVLTKNITISGPDPLANVTFNGGYTYSILSSGILTATGTVKLAGTSPVVINGGGAIYAQGDITITNTSTGAIGNINFVINGTGSQTFTGSGIAGEGRISSITVDKTTGTLTLASTISVVGNWTYTKGTVTSTGSTVAFYGGYNLDGQESGTANTMAFNNVTVNGNTRTLTGNLNVDGNFTIASGATCSAGSNTIYVGGDWNSTGTWTYSTSTVVFDGTDHNKIKGTGTVTFYNVTVNRSYSAGAPRSVKLQNPMQVNAVMILQKGRVITDATNYLHFPDGAVCTMFNDDSAYVCGPVRKTGDDGFKFPLGDTLLHDSIAYHPLDITAPSVTSDRFEAQYYAVGQTAGDSLVDSLTNLNDVEYWRLDRQVGTSNIITTLYWNANSDNVEDYNTLRVANWNNTKWLDLGGTNITVSNRTGSVTAVAPPTYVSNSALLTISNQVTGQAYAVLHRKLDGGYYLVKNGALYFMYDEEYNDTDDELSFTIYDEQRRTMASSTGTYAITELSDYGDNRFYINLFDCNTNVNGSLGSGTYILEVSNEKGEKWLLRFKHVTTITPNCPESGGGGGGE